MSRRTEIFALIEQGLNLKAICQRAGMTEGTARSYRTEWRKQHGLGRIPNPHPLRRQQVVELDAQGLSNTEIARRLGITVGAVSTMLIRLTTTIRSIGKL